MATRNEKAIGGFGQALKIAGTGVSFINPVVGAALSGAGGLLTAEEQKKKNRREKIAANRKDLGQPSNINEIVAKDETKIPTDGIDVTEQELSPRIKRANEKYYASLNPQENQGAPPPIEEKDNLLDNNRPQRTSMDKAQGFGRAASVIGTGLSIASMVNAAVDKPQDEFTPKTVTPELIENKSASMEAEAKKRRDRAVASELNRRRLMGDNTTSDIAALELAQASADANQINQVESQVDAANVQIQNQAEMANVGIENQAELTNMQRAAMISAQRGQAFSGSSQALVNNLTTAGQNEASIALYENYDKSQLEALLVQAANSGDVAEANRIRQELKKYN